MKVPANPKVSANPSPAAPELAGISALSNDGLSLIDLSSSDSDSGDDSSEFLENGILGIIGNNGGEKSLRIKDSLSGLPEKRRKTASNKFDLVVPEGSLRSITPAEESVPVLVAPPENVVASVVATPRGSTVILGGIHKQFWKAGDYEGAPNGDWDLSSGGMDHVRVHPKFLHSNATSHKWALGSFAELLDNALDELCNEATYVNVDMLENRKDGSRMLLVEDDGGGMNPEKMRHCMSLGYSAKSKIADTIGQYGNGFKTSTMRLGADVIVFSRCCGKDGRSSTQSIGLLSYTFLRSTRKEDIVVPMLDYERRGSGWGKIIRSSVGDWNNKVDTLVQWSPFSSEADLLRQFNLMKDHGTRIFIYNLWEDDHGMLELDFDADPSDIQLRGVNRDEKNIKMARQFPNSKHFLTYKHSLRSYASILYLRLPPGFRIILRGKDVEHHNIVNDMMKSEKVTYRPQYGADGNPMDSDMSAVVTIGFVKDAKHHIDVQGFNVYHKNRLVKPFWRIWNPAGSEGRGVIGVLEANFVEPAHDKQGFERTTVLSRLESRLIQMQKIYWTTNCHKIGYAPRRNKKLLNGSASREASPEFDAAKPLPSRKRTPSSVQRKPHSNSPRKHGGQASVLGRYKGNLVSSKGDVGGNTLKTEKRGRSMGPYSPIAEVISDDDDIPERTVCGDHRKSSQNSMFGSDSRFLPPSAQENPDTRDSPSKGDTTRQLHEALLREKERRRALESEVEEVKQKIEEFNKEQESLIDIFSEERERRDKEEEALRRKLQDASITIQVLLERIEVLEKTKTPNRRN